MQSLSNLEGLDLVQNLKRLVIRNLTLTPDALQLRLCKLLLLEYLDMHGVRLTSYTNSCLQSVLGKSQLRIQCLYLGEVVLIGKHK